MLYKNEFFHKENHVIEKLLYVGRSCGFSYELTL